MKNFLVAIEYGEELKWKTVIRAENERLAAKLFVFGYNFHKSKAWDEKTQTLDGLPVIVKEHEIGT